MSKTSGIFICALHIALICINQSVETKSPFFKNGDQRYEGNRCQLANGGGSGVCEKVRNCPVKMGEIQSGNYDERDRCGFENFDEIVCCEKTVSKSDKIKDEKKRRAETACEKYKQIVSELDAGFHSVVFNGEQANPGEYPHMAALGYVASNDEEGAINGRKYVCGGTLISEKHVVTAAHCVSNVHGLVPVEVLLGTIDLTKPDPKKMQQIPISRIIKHPEYRNSLNYHDIAIIELKNLVKFSNDVQPTCLITKSPQNPDTRLDILGWGAVDLEGTTSTRLLKAVGLKFVESTACSKNYENNLSHIPNGLDDGMICVVDANSTRKADTCWGDSGGPLLISSSKFPPVIGITSFGQACGGTTPGVYASIYKYLDWIEDQVWPSSN